MQIFPLDITTATLLMIIILHSVYLVPINVS